MSEDPYRLPTCLIPRSYTLEIRPDLEAAEFSGKVRIDVEVVEATDRVVLNVVDLELHDVTVDGVPVNDIALDPVSERATLTVGRTLAPGPTTVGLSFRGVLNDKLTGFYRSTFSLTDPTSGLEQQHTIAVTQFESTHARAAFPCFDEPAFKATFRISLIIDDSLFAVSNGREIGREPLGDGLVRVDFAETMVMSTYLVAFVVGPLVASETRSVAGAAGPIPLRIIHTPGSEHLCDFALEVAEAALLYFEDYYGIPYPGDKVDLVAVPDFAFGAMENLGCVTFREVLLLIDPETATQPELQRVADVINHELAHMWFGDLVTMKWWNGIWLNEAFATFMEIKASDAFRPQWDVWTGFGLARAAAFDTDALSSTRPIEYPVVSPADSEGMFDILTYEKGASVLRMLEQYLGEDRFRQGIAAYLAANAYGVTETTDLWDALEEASGEPVRRMMDGWIFQGGHPEVVMTTTEAGVHLGQHRFRYASAAPEAEPAPDPEPSWAVPLTIRYRTGDDGHDTEAGSRSLILDEDTELDLGGRPSLVQVNVAGNGFFRSRIERPLRAALAADASAPALERFMLLDDTCAALNSGDVTAAEVWELLEVVARTETEPAVWRRIGGAVRELWRAGAEPQRERDAARVLELTDPALDRLKKTLIAAVARGAVAASDELDKAREVRGVVAALRGTLGEDQHVREQARQIFRDGRIEGLPEGMIDASLRAAATEVVGYTATAAEHDLLRERWANAATPQEELRYLTALVDTDDPDLLTGALQLALSEVRSQNAPYLLQRAIAHRTHAAMVWDFVSGNWGAISDRFPANSLARMLAGIRSVTERSLAERIAADLTTIELPSGHKQVAQHAERMWVTVGTAERVRG